MIQELPLSSTPDQLEQTDPQVKEVVSAREFDPPSVAETTRALVSPKSGFSEDEASLKEEALRNAVIEIEVLGKTAAQAHAGAEKERRIRSEIEALRRTQAQRIEEDFAPAPGQTPSKEVEFQREDLAGVVDVPRAEAGKATFRADLDIPTEVIRRLNSDSSSECAIGLGDLARLGGENALQLIAQAFDEQSEEVRNAAARALFDFHPDRSASFARVLREGSPERRRRIGAALAASGLADIAIGNLAGQTREKGYEAFSLLFLMTKAGEVQPLVRAVEDHPNIEVRLAVVKLLSLNGEAEIVPFFRQLAVRGVLPSEVRAAVIESIYELGRQIPRELSSGVKG